MAKRIRLIHWNQEEAEVRAKRLKTDLYEIEFDVPAMPDFFRRLKENPPDAVAIDLSRLPSQGRDTALAIRQYKTMRRMPIVFIGGDPEKVDRIKPVIPDAVYTNWNGVLEALDQAIAHPPVNPVIPKSRLAGYADAPLTQKLGIKAGSIVLLIDAPEDFHTTIPNLPNQVIFIENINDQQDLIVWFVRFKNNLESRIVSIAERVRHGGLWIAWPKRTSGVESNLTQQQVRETGLASGLVDYKICSIDETWSGLLFTKRKVKDTE